MKRDIAGPGESRFFEGLFKQELASTKSSAMRAEPIRNSRGKSMIAFSDELYQIRRSAFRPRQECPRHRRRPRAGAAGPRARATLPDELGHDLHQPRVAAERFLGVVEVRVGDAGVRSRSRGADAADIADRSGDELGVVEEIVGLARNLEVVPLGDSKLLHDGEIDVADW